MMVTKQIPELVQEKLNAFERMQNDFEACFRYKQDVHGQRRFPAFSIEQVVFYLHSLWLCESKDRLLSVYKNIRRYEGERCLELLRTWQEGQSADLVAFLLSKLDMHSFADFTRQVEEARRVGQDEAAIQILEHGRLVMLNRGVNLMHVLETASVQPAGETLAALRRACMQYGHTPEQIAGQLSELTTPLYTYRPHAVLAQRNMTLMNHLGADTAEPAVEPSSTRSQYPAFANEPQAPFAQQVISGYQEMLAPTYNNVRGVRFVDRTEPERE